MRRAALGVGDDCALLVPAAGMQLAISSDMLVEGRHFLSTVSSADLGHKALAVNLSVYRFGWLGFGAVGPHGNIAVMDVRFKE